PKPTQTFECLKISGRRPPINPAARRVLTAAERFNDKQALPKDLPPKSTVWAYFDLWSWDGTLERIHHALYVAVRELAGREASPTTAIIDSQSAKGAQKGGPRLTCWASMRARRSRVASAISSIRLACCWAWRCMPPTFRIATG